MKLLLKTLRQVNLLYKQSDKILREDIDAEEEDVGLCLNQNLPYDSIKPCQLETKASNADTN